MRPTPEQFIERLQELAIGVAVDAKALEEAKQKAAKADALLRSTGPFQYAGRAQEDLEIARRIFESGKAALLQYIIDATERRP